jgi:2-aminomuconate deaminase
MNNSTTIICKNLDNPISSFHPHAKKVGNLIFISGIIPKQKDQKLIPGCIYDERNNVIGHDVKTQFHATIQNLKSILIDSNSSFENVVDITVFLTDIKRDFKLFNEAYGEVFQNILPARTTVEVSRLPSPVCIELKVIAHI